MAPRKQVAVIDPEPEVIEGEIVEDGGGITDADVLDDFRSIVKVDIAVDKSGRLQGTLKKDQYTKAKAEEMTEATRAAAAKIVGACNNLADRVQDVVDKIEDGYQHNIHIGSGYPSFGAWVLDVVCGQLTGLPTDVRKPLVRVLVGMGLSMNTVAKGLDVAVSTISRDVKETGEKPDTTTGIDGVTQSGGRPRKDTEDTEDEAEDEAEDEGTERKWSAKDFAQAVNTVAAQAELLIELSELSGFKTKAAQKKLFDAHGDDILAATNSLLDLCDKMGIQVFDTEPDEAEDDEDDGAEEIEIEDDTEESDEDDTEESDELDEDEEPF